MDSISRGVIFAILTSKMKKGIKFRDSSVLSFIFFFWKSLNLQKNIYICKLELVCEIFANLRHLTPETSHKMELTRKTRKQSVFVDTYRCYYMSIVIWIFYMGTKFRLLLISRFYYNP